MPEFKSPSSYDYFEAGKRSKNQSEEMAESNFFSLAEQHGVNTGPYGSWDQFWMGYGKC